jgi:hypothetical protein
LGSGTASFGTYDLGGSGTMTVNGGSIASFQLTVYPTGALQLSAGSISTGFLNVSGNVNVSGGSLAASDEINKTGGTLVDTGTLSIATSGGNTPYYNLTAGPGNERRGIHYYCL